MPLLFLVLGEPGSPGIFGPVFALGARVTIVIRALISVSLAVTLRTSKGRARYAALPPISRAYNNERPMKLRVLILLPLFTASVLACSAGAGNSKSLEDQNKATVLRQSPNSGVRAFSRSLISCTPPSSFATSSSDRNGEE